MNYQSPQLLDELAAQYAIGTLRGPARRRFERLCRSEPAAQNAVYRWEEKLVGLMAEVKPVQPPKAVWEKIQQRLKHGAASSLGEKESGGFFARLFGGTWTRTQLAMAAGVVALALTLSIVTYVANPRTQTMATIKNEQQAEQWLVETVKDHSK